MMLLGPVTYLVEVTARMHDIEVRPRHLIFLLPLPHDGANISRTHQRLPDAIEAVAKMVLSQQNLGHL